MKLNVGEKLGELWKQPFVRFSILILLALVVIGVVWSLVSPAA